MRRGHGHAATAVMALALAATLPACGAGQEPAPTPTAVSAACEPAEHPPIQLGTHLVGDASPPAPYSSTPPTSGWHTSRVPPPGIADPPLSNAEIVSALENGIVVVAAGPDVDLTTAQRLIDQFPDRLVVTNYTTDMPTAVALLTWGKLVRCDRLDPAAITNFVLTERVGADTNH